MHLALHMRSDRLWICHMSALAISQRVWTHPSCVHRRRAAVVDKADMHPQAVWPNITAGLGVRKL